MINQDFDLLLLIDIDGFKPAINNIIEKHKDGWKALKEEIMLQINNLSQNKDDHYVTVTDGIAFTEQLTSESTQND